MKKAVLYLLLLLMTCFISDVYSQKRFTAVNAESSVKVKGTSTLHDWVMSMSKFTCTLEIITEGAAITIQSASFSGESGSLESGNEIMNTKTYDALKAKEFPNMTFSLNKEYSVQSVDSVFGGTVEGILQLAGKTKQIFLDFKGTKVSENIIALRGSKKLKMTDFDVSPPTAMFGTIKTGDEITVVFVIVLSLE